MPLVKRLKHGIFLFQREFRDFIIRFMANWSDFISRAFVNVLMHLPRPRYILQFHVHNIRICA